jgi:hypothetical protein
MTISQRGILFTHSLRSAGVALLFAALAYGQTGLAGHWEGVVVADNNNEIGVTLDLAKNAKSRWIASTGIPVSAEAVKRRAHRIGCVREMREENFGMSIPVEISNPVLSIGSRSRVRFSANSILKKMAP